MASGSQQAFTGLEGKAKNSRVGFHEQGLGCSWTSLISNISQGQRSWGRWWV